MSTICLTFAVTAGADSSAIHRFKNEFRSLAEISHPARASALLAASSHDARLLRDCLDESEDAIYPVVSLGTQELCDWYRSDDESVICEGRDPVAGLECPYEPDVPGTCSKKPADPGGGV